MFANPKGRGLLVRTAVGVGLSLAAIGAVGFGCGIAGASPQQPVLVDDPAPAPPGIDPATAVNVANALLRPLNSLLGSILPGSLMPGGGDPGTLMPGQTPATPGYPGTPMPGQYPGTPSYPGTPMPGQTPVMPGYPGPVSPGRSPVYRPETGPVV